MRTAPPLARPFARSFDAGIMFGITILATLLAGSLANAGEGYRLPPADIVAAVDAPATPSVELSPDAQWMLIVESADMPTIADLSRPMLRLAGMRIDPSANGSYSTRFDRKITLREVHGTRSIPIPIAKDARIGRIAWSHRSNAFAYTIVTDHGTELWLASIDHAMTPRRLTDRLNTMFGAFTFTPAGDALICNLVPQNRGAAPAAPSVPDGPTIQDTAGQESPLRTYQDLLKNAHDADLFEYYATTQPARIDFAGRVFGIGQPGVYTSIEPSPDGKHLLVTRLREPYSYDQPFYGFAQRIAVWSPIGVIERDLASRPIAANVPIGGVPTGPRSHQWLPNRDASIAWVEALDAGDPKTKASLRDAWFMLEAPFDGAPRTILRTEYRASGLTCLADADRIIAREYDRDRRWLRATLHDLSGQQAPIVLEDRSRQDRYGDPGSIVMTHAGGRALVRQDGPWIYRIGSGASPKGDLPFIDRQNIDTLETQRQWQCSEGIYESVARVVESTEAGIVSGITRRETPTSPPNFYFHEAGSAPVAMTAFEDPTPQLRGIHKELVRYQRADGVPLSATLYLPAGYQAGTRLPMVVWAYPREYASAKVASQVRTSPSRFTRIRGTSHLHLLSQGYAILDGATMPIIGDPETMNDTFIEQLVASAKAAIDYAVERGVADRDRVAIAGHSYGAFMTANLLAHSDLFAAGIARSGAYNRTLTPFGFQSERRTLWQAKDVYFSISPFMHADAINEPLLLIHGEQDNNSGTFPLQSRRLFAAIKGNGGTARLVMLPKESHGYRARESVLHTLAESVDWLDRYVKHRRDSAIQPAGFERK